MPVDELRLRGITGSGFVTFKWEDGKGVGDEILETIRMAVSGLKEVQGVVVTRIMEYNKDSFEGVKSLCSYYNKTIETLLSLWSGTSKLHELQTLPSFTFLEHVLRRCYKNFFTDSSHQKMFDIRKFDIIDTVVKQLRMTEDDVFTDINCGYGEVVIQVAASCSFKYCCGIDTSDQPSSEPESMITEFRKWMKFYGKDYTDCFLLQEDLMSDEMSRIILESTVLFLKDFNVNSKLKSQLSMILCKLKEGTRIISFESVQHLFESCERTVEMEECKIRPNETRYYIHTVKCQSKAFHMVPPTYSIAQRRKQTVTRKNKCLTTSNDISDVLDLVSVQDATVPEGRAEAESLAEAANSRLFASLDNVLACYRNQFIKFVKFMETPQYRAQLERALKQELLRKTELERLAQSLTLQINELSGTSQALMVTKKSPSKATCTFGIDGHFNDDLLAKVNDLVSYNRQLKKHEELLNEEINHLERMEILKQCHNHLLQMKLKEGDLSTLNRQYLLSKASEWYEKYFRLNQKLYSLETEVEILEITKESVDTNEKKLPVRRLLLESDSPVLPYLPVRSRLIKESLLSSTEQVKDQHASGTLKIPTQHDIEQTSILNKLPGSERTCKNSPFHNGMTLTEADKWWKDETQWQLHSPCSYKEVLKEKNAAGGGFQQPTPLHLTIHGVDNLVQKNRRFSSSSTDTADSEPQDLKHREKNLDSPQRQQWSPFASSVDQTLANRLQILPTSSREISQLSSLREQRRPHYSPSVGLNIASDIKPNMVLSFPQTTTNSVLTMNQEKPRAEKRRKRTAKFSNLESVVSDSNLQPVRSKQIKPAGSNVLGRLDSSVEPISNRVQLLLNHTSGGTSDTRFSGFKHGLGLCAPDEHGYAKSSLAERTLHMTDTDPSKLDESGNLDALFLAVSLHNLPPSCRNLSQDSTVLMNRLTDRYASLPSPSVPLQTGDPLHSTQGLRSSLLNFPSSLLLNQQSQLLDSRVLECGRGSSVLKKSHAQPSLALSSNLTKALDSLQAHSLASTPRMSGQDGMLSQPAKLQTGSGEKPIKRKYQNRSLKHNGERTRAGVAIDCTIASNCSPASEYTVPIPKLKFDKQDSYRNNATASDSMCSRLAEISASKVNECDAQPVIETSCLKNRSNEASLDLQDLRTGTKSGTSDQISPNCYTVSRSEAPLFASWPVAFPQITTISKCFPLQIPLTMRGMPLTVQLSRPSVNIPESVLSCRNSTTSGNMQPTSSPLQKSNSSSPERPGGKLKLAVHLARKQLPEEMKKTN